MKEVYFFATPKETFGSLIKDQVEQIWIAKLWNKKFAIYRQSFTKGETGYKVYNSIEEIEKLFTLENKLVKLDY